MSAWRPAQLFLFCEQDIALAERTLCVWRLELLCSAPRSPDTLPWNELGVLLLEAAAGGGTGLGMPAQGRIQLLRIYVQKNMSFT